MLSLPEARPWPWRFSRQAAPWRANCVRSGVHRDCHRMTASSPPSGPRHRVDKGRRGPSTPRGCQLVRAIHPNASPQWAVRVKCAIQQSAAGCSLRWMALDGYSGGRMTLRWMAPDGSSSFDLMSSLTLNSERTANPPNARRCGVVAGPAPGDREHGAVAGQDNARPPIQMATAAPRPGELGTAHLACQRTVQIGWARNGRIARRRPGGSAGFRGSGHHIWSPS